MARTGQWGWLCFEGTGQGFHPPWLVMDSFSSWAGTLVPNARTYSALWGANIQVSQPRLMARNERQNSSVNLPDGVDPHTDLVAEETSKQAACQNCWGVAVTAAVSTVRLLVARSVFTQSCLPVVFLSTAAITGVVCWQSLAVRLLAAKSVFTQSCLPVVFLPTVATTPFLFVSSLLAVTVWLLVARSVCTVLFTNCCLVAATTLLR